MLRRTGVQLMSVMAIAAIILFLRLGSARLWDRDEPRNAGCAVEMMQRGDWVVPMFNDELRFQKPVLLYWLMGSAYQLFGVSEFAARFWSAVLALGTVGLTYAVGRRILNPGAAAMGALCLATSMMFVVAGRAATPDSALIFCQTLALTIYVYGTFGRKHQFQDPPRLRVADKYFPQSTTVAAAMYGAMGIGVLAKGLIGVLMPSAILGLFILIATRPSPLPQWLDRQGKLARLAIQVLSPFSPRHFLSTCWQMRPLLAATMVVLVAGPWFVLVGMRTDGEFLKLFFGSEHFGRATSVFENHAGGWWYYPIAIGLGFFPWSIFFLPMAMGIDRRLSSRDPLSAAFVFLLCWIGVQIGLFSLFATKLPSYVTPAFPALALCFGFHLHRWSREKNWAPRILDRAVFATVGLVGIGLTIAVAMLCVRYLHGNYWLAALGAPWIVVGAHGLTLKAGQGQRGWIAGFCLAAILFSGGLFGFGASAIGQLQQVERILQPIRERSAAVASYHCLESSWVYYAGQPIHELKSGEAAERAPATRAHFWERKPRLSPADFVQRFPGALFITTDQAWNELRGQLPAQYQVVQVAPYFLRDKNLLLVAPASDPRWARGVESGSSRR